MRKRAPEPLTAAAVASEIEGRRAAWAAKAIEAGRLQCELHDEQVELARLELLRSNLEQIEAAEQRDREEADAALTEAGELERQLAALTAQTAKLATAEDRLPSLLAELDGLRERRDALDEQRQLAGFELRERDAEKAARELSKVGSRIDALEAEQAALEQKIVERTGLLAKVDAQRTRIAERRATAHEARERAAGRRLEVARAVEQSKRQREHLRSLAAPEKRQPARRLDPPELVDAGGGLFVAQDGLVVNTNNGAIARLG